MVDTIRTGIVRVIVISNVYLITLRYREYGQVAVVFLFYRLFRFLLQSVQFQAYLLKHQSENGVNTKQY